MHNAVLPRTVCRPLAAVTRVLPPACTALCLAALWGADVAGTWLLPDNVQVVVNGAAVAVSFAILSRWAERRADKRAQTAVFEASQERAALIRTIERLTGGAQTGPIQRLRDVA